MEETKIIIPCHWNKKLLSKIVANNLQFADIKVKEIYGSLAKGIIRHGRDPNSVVSITKKDAINFKKYANSLGINFIYLLNAPFNFNKYKEKDKIQNYLDWIVNKFKADALMVASYDLMKFIRIIYPDIPIYISTVAGIKNFEELKKYLDINPTRVVPHHDVNRNLKDLENLVLKTKKLNIEIELMVTESCLRRCPHRVAHYKYLGEGNTDKSFHTVCNLKRLKYPREILKSNFIRPEDLIIYEKMGIKSFKITGRSKPATWLLEVVNAYFKKEYKGNLLRLLGTDPSLELEKWVYVDNKSLDNFLSGFLKNKKEEDENLYCDRFISKLYIERKFKINDGSKYELNSNKSLVCCIPGKKISSIIS